MALTSEWWAPSYDSQPPFGARSQSPNLSGLVSMLLSGLGGTGTAGEQGKYSPKCVTASVPQLIGSSHVYTLLATTTRRPKRKVSPPSLPRHSSPREAPSNAARTEEMAARLINARTQQMGSVKGLAEKRHGERQSEGKESPLMGRK
ncbi:unnamed protein product [Pleuronectes platessa]|uniref:Uncharacterized protein n=1 Tax=Pleuronectes platessa TaxID=8262 RepID=A0A9N7TXU4_PLEPL|nr:unnamed protein product [Pleuronectes platessa]